VKGSPEEMQISLHYVSLPLAAAAVKKYDALNATSAHSKQALSNIL